MASERVAIVVIVAVVSGLLAAGILTSLRRTGDDPLTPESAQEIEAAARDGRDWAPDAGQHWTIRHPVESGIGVGILVLVIGLLVIIALHSGERRQ